MTTVSYRNQTGTGAENYERFFVPAIATPVSGRLLEAAALQPGERVLDVACGTGLIARLAAEQVGPTGTVTGVDVAADMLDLARRVAVSGGAPIEWHEGDAAELPFPDESFDVVTCQMGLMFFDRSAALAEMRRVLAPGGRVVVNTPGTIQTPFELMEQAIVDHISADLAGFIRVVFSLPDPDTLGGLLDAAGFADTEANRYTATFDLPGPAEFLWEYINLTPLGPFVADAPEAAQVAMERQVVEGWQSFVVDGRTPLDQPMAIATGRRA